MMPHELTLLILAALAVLWALGIALLALAAHEVAEHEHAARCALMPRRLVKRYSWQLTHEQAMAGLRIRMAHSGRNQPVTRLVLLRMGSV